jgi:two-component system, cell cycle response regulator DivK
MVHALVIDDNRNNIEVLTTLLEREGVQPTAVTSVQHVAQVLDKQVDVIFLDLEFPTGDGFEMLKTLKADSRLSGVPVVAYSVHTSEIDRARRAGFDSFLGKPLDMQRFPGQLQRILNHQPVWDV